MGQRRSHLLAMRYGLVLLLAIFSYNTFVGIGALLQIDDRSHAMMELQVPILKDEKVSRGSPSNGEIHHQNIIGDVPTKRNSIRAAPQNDTLRRDEDGVLILENWTWFQMQKLPSPLHDKTIPWNPKVDHVWTRHAKSYPPAMLLLTEYGWNQPKQRHGHYWLRFYRTRDLMRALYDHSWFHPFGYDAIQLGNLTLSTDIRYYIFLDMETCGDKHYPIYGQTVKNMDQLGDRGRQHGLSHEDEIKDLLSQPIMQQPIYSRVVIFDCNGYTRSVQLEDQYWRREWNKDQRLVLASLSANESQLLPGDFGLPPLPCVKCTLSSEQRIRILKCQDEPYRPYLLSFSGNFRAKVRQDLRMLHNGKDILVSSPEEMVEIMNLTDQEEMFTQVAMQSKFAAVPRGDNLYSYRFTEVIGCGAIPVVYSDGWVLPFKGIIDPTTYALVIPENEVKNTETILASISEERRCRLRKSGLKAYEKYFRDSKANIRGVVESLEAEYKSTLPLEKA